MSGILSMILGGLFKCLTGWVDKLLGNQWETEAKAKAEALKSVNEARALEQEMREMADLTSPPLNPKEGQRWFDPYTNTTKEWRKGEWKDVEADTTDIFGDNAWND